MLILFKVTLMLFFIRDQLLTFFLNHLKGKQAVYLLLVKIARRNKQNSTFPEKVKDLRRIFSIIFDITGMPLD